ncbi:hypothetical protein [Mycobacterium sp. 1274756.6]|uniref:hypothetical protein n=1 Tax=Mycobacterium sp. 1274756.6 TaxID=1834076 RepID=UPI0007FCD163|nr:hypothetical protein [Mycobacterium sp. 1274756.6]OBJ68083.1 hypothetical protein A5643_15090 [Mycobacterium sp. 1274756.6]
MATDADPAERKLSDESAAPPSAAGTEPAEPAAEDLSSPVSMMTREAGVEPEDDAENGAEDDDTEDDGCDTGGAAEATIGPRKLAGRFSRPLSVGMILVVIAGAVAGWLGYQSYQARAKQQQRQLLLQVGRQAVLNLTTIDWQHAEADVQRILDSATEDFYEEFSQRQGPFIDVVKKAQSKSVGTISEAALWSDDAGEAEVLAAVAVETKNIGAEEQDPRNWRMKVTVKMVDGEAKVSNVEFVP